MGSVILRVEGLKKFFGGVKAVDGCAFAVEKGKVTALIGPNGAGKTTVFNLVSGFLTQDSGTIEFFGKRIERMPAWKRARLGIARTFQQVRLFQNLTLEENLLVAAEEGDESLWKGVVYGRGRKFSARTAGAIHESPVQEVLANVGIDRAPEALASELSFGQQKLLEFARANVFPHTLLMLDEPVAGVAPHLRSQFIGMIEGLRQRGATILLVEHDMEFVMRIADQVIVMDEGSVLTQGTPAEVRRHPQVLEAYLGEQL